MRGDYPQAYIHSKRMRVWERKWSPPLSEGTRNLWTRLTPMGKAASKERVAAAACEERQLVARGSPVPADQEGRAPGGASPPGGSSAPAPIPAFVMCDFVALPESGELSVQRGTFVDVLLDDEPVPPEGWCLCRVSREGAADAPPSGRRSGLVPWSHIVSAAHAEIEAQCGRVSTPCTASHLGSALDPASVSRRSPSLMRSGRPPPAVASVGAPAAAAGSDDTLPGPPVRRGSDSASGSVPKSRSVPVRRTSQGFGVDVNERNIIVRIVPGSAADEDARLEVVDASVARG